MPHNKVQPKGKTEAQEVIKPQKPIKLTPKQQGFALLRGEGLTVENAARSCGLDPKYGYTVEKKLTKYNLTSSKMLSLAHSAVKNIVQGLPVGDSDAPKPSTILDAAKMSMDRAFPLKTINESTSLHTFINVKVDMGKYKSSQPEPLLPVIDAVLDTPYDV